jgi:hypothetical protein
MIFENLRRCIPQYTVCLSMLLSAGLAANMGPQGFHQFKNQIFVETGTFSGDGIQKALDAGFEEVYSIDIDEKQVQNSLYRFRNQKNVHVFVKDSSYQLWDVIKGIKMPVVFWLDAHNGFPDPNAIGVKNTPLLEELEQIKRHPIKTHTILIDDLHCCGTLLFDFLTLDQIIAKVREINPKYVISFVDGGDDGEYKNNVLVASIPSKTK